MSLPPTVIIVIMVIVIMHFNPAERNGFSLRCGNGRRLYEDTVFSGPGLNFKAYT